VEVPVDRPYPVYVDRRVSVPEPYPIEVPVQVPVYVPVEVPVEVPVDRPYPVEVRVPEPYPVEVPVGIPQTFRVDPPRPVALPPAYPVGLVAPSLPFGRLGFGSPVPEVPVAIPDPYALLGIEDCNYPDPTAFLLPGKFPGLLPHAFKEDSPFHRHGYHGF
jgi:hypothetical protein